MEINFICFMFDIQMCAKEGGIQMTLTISLADGELQIIKQLQMKKNMLCTN